MSIWVIVNKAAGSGKGASALAKLKERMPGLVVRETEREHGGVAPAREARHAGASQVIVIGGDGTISQTVEGLTLDDAQRPESAGPALCVLPAGTGGDYRRTFDWSEDIDACIARLSRVPTLVDVGLVTLTAPDGSEVKRTFTNVLSFGVGGLTDRIVERGPKWLGGRAAFYLGAVAATLSYDSAPIELTLDGEILRVDAYKNVAVCLGRYFGGGMKVAPNADPSDGLFELVTFGGTKLQTLALSSAIYQGTHLERSFVNAYRGKKLVARATRRSEILVDLDGEQPGQLPLSVEVLPKALPLLV